MLDSIWHLRGSVQLDGVVANDAALDCVEALLERQRKPVTERGPDHIAFDSPLWEDILSPNWLAMVIYDRGRIWIDHGLQGRRLRYDLRSFHGFVFCLIGAFMFFFFGLAEGGLAGGLRFAGMVFGWLYGMNMLLAWTRIPHAIRTAVRKA